MRVAVFGDINLHEDAMSMTIARRYAELSPFDGFELQSPGIRVMAQKLQREIAQRANDDYQNRDAVAHIMVAAEASYRAAERSRHRATWKPKKMRAAR